MLLRIGRINWRLRITRRRAALYVCICNAIRENELRRAARHCTGDADAVYASLGKRPQCRQCLDEAAEILFEEREMGFERFALAG